MKTLKQSLFLLFFTLSFSSTFSQSKDSLMVSPNPFDQESMITFHLAASDTITLRVYDMLGQVVMTLCEELVMERDIYHVVLNGRSLESGMYLIRLDIGSSKTLSYKVIKMGALGLEDNTLTGKTPLFPNPTNGLLTVPMDGLKTIVIEDLIGTKVKSCSTDQSTISLSGLSAGLYQVTVLDQQNKRVTTQKILKTE